MTTYVHPTAHIGVGVELGDRVWVGAHVSIDGERAGVLIGNGCVIGPGTRIGQAGFGYELDEAGAFCAKDHPYGVVLDENVHVGANACIDRGSWRLTRIGAGTKIDNLVHIAHNVVIGRNCLVVALAEISGSVTIEDAAYIAPGARVRERLTVGARSVVGLGAVVVKDVPADVTVAGVPARVIGPADGPPPPPKGHE